MKTWIAALALTSALTAPSVWADDSAGSMTLKDFRARNDAAQTYMVLGALALTDRLGLACPHVVTVREWKAGLLRPDLDVTLPWVDMLGKLMDERGCAVKQVKGDT